ncbi:hypothetical protein Cs7R123_11340 [Catellatospora sp. TT07R-123]|uniref:WD40 repeat domain-containing protein n=1 Tax=Catellatospora sp. TT07R-123 TaxID=2733863 RepID=UPI001B0801C4|nr:WD40 repeat domain-containing protein [Catellatospora sp. TT07R-123]GHJ43792.1 hypothetical protein Cs7R123_11340 [Catellatospora sp. TT07R-123]
MSDQQIAALFAAAPSAAEPPLPPGHLEQVLGAARRDRRRRRVTAALTAIVVLLLGGTAVAFVPGGFTPPVEPAVGPAGLPDEIAGYSPLTGLVSQSPPGRALMLYGYGNSELFNTYQTLVLGADGDVYRQVDAARDTSGMWLLSPDGRFIVLGDDTRVTSAVTVVDLATGDPHEVPLGRSGGVIPLALSPDGDILAYSLSDAKPLEGDLNNRVSGVLQQYASNHSTLMLLNLRTGQTTATDTSPVAAVSFAPDGQRMAVQSRSQTWLLGRDGQRIEQVPVPENYGITAQNAWSTDGTKLALNWWAHDSWGTDESFYPDLSPSGGFGVVSLDRPGTLVRPQAQVEHFLGWLSGTEWLGLSWDYGADTGALWAMPADGAEGRVLSRFDNAKRCEFGTQRCVPWEPVVAAGLIAGITVREAGWAERGPWPVPYRWAALVGLLVVAGVVLLVRRRGRRRRARRPAAS